MCAGAGGDAAHEASLRLAKGSGRMIPIVRRIVAQALSSMGSRRTASGRLALDSLRAHFQNPRRRSA